MDSKPCSEWMALGIVHWAVANTQSQRCVLLSAYIQHLVNILLHGQSRPKCNVKENVKVITQNHVTLTWAGFSFLKNGNFTLITEQKPQKASQLRLSANTKLSVPIFLFSLAVIFLSVINIGLVNKFLSEKTTLWFHWEPEFFQAIILYSSHRGETTGDLGFRFIMNDFVFV